MNQLNFIPNLQRINPLFEQNNSVAMPEPNKNLFSEIFGTAIGDVISTQKEVDKQQYLITTGQSDSAHDIQIATSEAGLAVDMLVQLRNKALDSYNELMRTNL